MNKFIKTVIMSLFVVFLVYPLTATASQKDMSTTYNPITLDVPFYSQGKYYPYGDCGISSIAMVEAYRKGYGSNDLTVYNAVYDFNGSTFLESYSRLGYSTISNDLSAIYEQLQHDSPVIVYRTGNGKDHYSVVYGYNGSTSELEAKGFMVLNTYHVNGGAMVGPGNIGYSNLEEWLSGANWTHTMIRNANPIPLKDKTSGSCMFNQVWASNISETNAQINAYVPYQYMTDCGFYFGSQKDNMTKVKETEIGSGMSFNQMFFDLNKYGIRLRKNTDYFYKFYVTVNGITYYSNVYSFYTGIKETSPLQETYTVTWLTDTSKHSVGESNCVLAVKVLLDSITNKSVSEVGITLKDSNGKTIKTYSEKAELAGESSLYIWYNVTERLGLKLSPNTKYKYTIYMIVNGKRVESPEYEVITLDHSWDNGNITKYPDCTVNGIKLYTCSECKETKTETIKANGHKVTSWTDEGSKDYGKCTICSATVERPSEIPDAVKPAGKPQQPAWTIKDVSPTAWYYKNIKAVFVNGYMMGVSETEFSPLGNMTIAEAITIASRIHYYMTTSKQLTVKSSAIWYSGYVDYAVENNIISANDYDNYSKSASRADMAYIFSNCIELEIINSNVCIPDVGPDSKHYSSIHSLYEAGVLAGADEKGSFYPDRSITRAEVATIVARITGAIDKVTQ